MATNSSGTAPHTAIVPGQGASAVTYTLPAGLYQYIESVVATVDTSGSGDVTAVLTVADDSSTVIADKEQARAITAGGSGRATWALRLTDEGGGAAPAVTGFEEFANTNAGSVGAAGSVALTWTKIGGDDLLDLTTPTLPSVVADGIYAVSVTVIPHDDHAAITPGLLFGAVLDGIGLGAQGSTPWSATGGAVVAIPLSVTSLHGAGPYLRVQGVNGTNALARFEFGGFVQRLA